MTIFNFPPKSMNILIYPPFYLEDDGNCGQGEGVGALMTFILFFFIINESKLKFSYSI